MSDDYLWNRSGDDPEIAKLEKLLAPLGHDAPLDELRLRRRPRVRWIILGAGVVAAAAIAIYLALPGHDRACVGGTGFAFTGRGGDVSCGGTAVASGVLPVGANLDTGAHGASLSIATIGTAELGPHTRVRLEETSAHHHHLALDEGTLHATVNAPPRLFEVSTKHTSVVDLGCEYSIEVDATGAGSIAVLHGKVELATPNGMIVVAPMGTHARILAGNQPGVPVTGRNATLATAIEAYERGAPAALAAVLASAETPDAITLVGLAAIDNAHRAEILRRLAALSPPPGDVTVESALAGGAPFDDWREDIVSSYFGLWRP
jgi:hypothetical protein